jgi:hypothetical protein
MGNAPTRLPRGKFEVGDRVEVRDGGEDWDVGTVIALEEDGQARVRKDDYDSDYLWDECRWPQLTPKQAKTARYSAKQLKKEQKLAEKQEKKYADLLTRRGFDLNDLGSKTSWVGFSSMTAMAYASRSGNVDLCAYISRHSGGQAAHDVSTPDSDGWTPMLYAVRHGHLDVAEWLYRNGAAADVRIKKTKTKTTEDPAPSVDNTPPGQYPTTTTGSSSSMLSPPQQSLSVLAEAGRSGSLKMLQVGWQYK